MVKTGRITVGEDGRIHVATADAMLDGGVTTVQEGAEEARAIHNDIDAEKLLHEKAKRQLAELKVKEAEGQLIPISVIKEADFKTIRTWRDTLLGVADRLSAKCAATTDEREVNRIINAEIRSTLDAMANGVDYGRAGDRVKA